MWMKDAQMLSLGKATDKDTHMRVRADFNGHCEGTAVPDPKMMLMSFHRIKSIKKLFLFQKKV